MSAPAPRRILVVKTSSLGDVVHTLPALTDAARACSGLAVDWAVEEAFAEIPSWHPAVARVIPVALRRWRRRPLRSLGGSEWRCCRGELRRERYAAVVDAQGLLKSAWLATRARGPRIGYDRGSVREGAASLVYHRRVAVPHALHAVERSRQLFAEGLGYPIPRGRGDYRLPRAQLAERPPGSGPVLFLHGTTRGDKEWPRAHWCELARRLGAAGQAVALPWGNEREHAVATAIAAASARARVLPRASLRELAGLLAAAPAVVAVDTGLGHLSAALGVPTISLYGPTDPAFIGTYGEGQIHLEDPAAQASGSTHRRGDMGRITVERVHAELAPLLR